MDACAVDIDSTRRVMYRIFQAVKWHESGSVDRKQFARKKFVRLSEYDPAVNLLAETCFKVFSVLFSYQSCSCRGSINNFSCEMVMIHTINWKPV